MEITALIEKALADVEQAQDHTAAIEALRALSTAVNDRLTAVVVDGLIRHGITYRQLGHALGCTHQAAHAKYAGKVNGEESYRQWLQEHSTPRALAMIDELRAMPPVPTPAR